MKERFSLPAAVLCLALLAGCGAASPSADGPDPCGTSEDLRLAAEQEVSTPFGDQWQENGTLAEYENGNIALKLTLPEGWDWQEDTSENTEGILFWDSEKPDQRFLLAAWPQGFGMCGTGVDFTEVTLPSGGRLTEAREDAQGGGVFLTLIFQGTPGSYTLQPQGGTLNGTIWDAKWRDQILTILDTAQLGGDALTEEEAVQRAEARFDGSFDQAYGFFDLSTGQWTVRFLEKEQETGSLTLDPEGNILP